MALYDILSTGCFFIPNTRPLQWTYGLLEENVMPGAKLGTFVMEDGSFQTFKVSVIKKALPRMLNTSEIPGKAWEPPLYIKRYAEEKIYCKLAAHHNKFLTHVESTRAFILEKSKDEFR